jgi:hypothetical protein
LVSLRRALEDPTLLGLHDPSWLVWRSALLASRGERLTAEEATAFANVSGGRAVPTKPVGQFVAAVSRRAGKSRVCGAVAAYTATCVEYPSLAPGEVGTFAIVAPTKAQSGAVLAYALGFLRSSALLKDEILEAQDDCIKLKGGTEIAILASSFRTLRSKTLIGGCLDEASFLADQESSKPDAEAVRALLPSMATTSGTLLIFSSPFKRSGVVYETHKDFFGKDSDDVLVIAGPTRDFNGTIPESVVEAARRSDPIGAISEWLGGWRDEAEAYIVPELLEEAIDQGVRQRAYDEQHIYTSFCDLSFGKVESSACSIVHTEDDVIVQDALLEVMPPASTSDAVEQIVSLLQSYHLAETMSDGAAEGWVRSEFRRHDMGFEVAPRKTATKTQLYVETAPLFASRRVRLLDCPKVIAQYRALQRKMTSTGRVVIDHPHGKHQKMDDCCNATAGSLWRGMKQKQEGIVATMGRNPRAMTDLISQIRHQQTGERAMAQRAWAQARRFRYRLFQSSLIPPPTFAYGASSPR